MIKITLICLAVIISAILIYAATCPDTFRVQRSAKINASPEKIFPLINNLHGMNTWSPYAKIDPNMKENYRGTAIGKGSVYEWEGNKQVGKGNIEVVESVPYSSVRMNLNMISPVAAQNSVEFTLQPEGTSTIVTWAINGNVPFMAKIIHLFMDMDKMIGGNFEQGLTELKSLAETPATQDLAITHTFDVMD